MSILKAFKAEQESLHQVNWTEDQDVASEEGCHKFMRNLSSKVTIGEIEVCQVG